MKENIQSQKGLASSIISKVLSLKEGTIFQCFKKCKTLPKIVSETIQEIGKISECILQIEELKDLISQMEDLVPQINEVYNLIPQIGGFQNLSRGDFVVLLAQLRELKALMPKRIDELIPQITELQGPMKDKINSIKMGFGITQDLSLEPGSDSAPTPSFGQIIPIPQPDPQTASSIYNPDIQQLFRQSDDESIPKFGLAFLDETQLPAPQQTIHLSDEEHRRVISDNTGHKLVEKKCIDVGPSITGEIGEFKLIRNVEFEFGDDGKWWIVVPESASDDEGRRYAQYVEDCTLKGGEPVSFDVYMESVDMIFNILK